MTDMTGQIHPDKMADKVAQLMKDHGYGLTQIKFYNENSLNGVCLPRYEYEVDMIETYTFGKGVEGFGGVVRGGEVK